jgi:hypothetical protein
MTDKEIQAQEIQLTEYWERVQANAAVILAGKAANGHVGQSEVGHALQLAIWLEEAVTEKFEADITYLTTGVKRLPR